MKVRRRIDDIIPPMGNVPTRWLKFIPRKVNLKPKRTVDWIHTLCNSAQQPPIALPPPELRLRGHILVHERCSQFSICSKVYTRRRSRNSSIDSNRSFKGTFQKGKR
ncbi:unnamed protein product [Lactuca virosa]|uniref:Uncharacterized protein n=1 Tax=Lactuca virosa TaxID=75947 RepID=A0AAU9NWW1_9ASTR|nr:unnamed protein product [Lactuca virosa]